MSTEMVHNLQPDMWQHKHANWSCYTYCGSGLNVLSLQEI